MDVKPSALAIRSLVVVAIVAAIPVSPISRHDAGTATTPDQARTDRPASAPIILAQGRCFNGRCY